ncbi:MAG: hypothetical protein ACYTXC_11010 [Nostoc sp.]
MFPPVSGTQHLTEYLPNYPPFRGGQAPGVRYIVTGQVDVYIGDSDDGTYNAYINNVYGPVKSVQTRPVDFNSQDGLDWGGRSTATPPSSIPVQGRAHPIPDAFSPVPKAATAPSPKTTEQAAIDKQSQKIDD